MKRMVYLFAALALVHFSGCKKSGSSPSKTKGGTTTAMRPATSTFIQTGGVTSSYTYTYDSNNNLTKIVNSDGTYEIDVDAHTMVQTSVSSPYTVINTFAYSAGSNLPVDIYTDIPGQLSISTTEKNSTEGTSTSYAGYLWDMSAGKDKTLAGMATSDNGGETVAYTYDANDNLKTITWTQLSGAQAGKAFATLTVTALDDKPSPFSAVAGYNIFSYTQDMYVPDYALAFCKNNPTQIIYSQFDYNKGALEPIEQDDFSYGYNAQGYPASVAVKVTYLTNNSSVVNKTYTYTYK